MPNDTYWPVEGMGLTCWYLVICAGVKVKQYQPSDLFEYKAYVDYIAFFLSQTEIETHAQPGTLSLYVHYGQSRSKDAKVLAQSDVVLTTYGVLASEFSVEVLYIS